MQQVLFEIPGLGWPIFGFGVMLFLAYFFCTWMASWLAKKEGIPPHSVYDLGIWIFVGGIVGARIVYMIQYQESWLDFYKIWNGGIVFYGSAIGGLLGYAGAYYFILSKYKISTWKMADIIAPCAALGLCLGRIGCLLNGCCYGNVACPDCASISFKLPTPPRFALVKMGYQTAAGFTLKGDAVNVVDRVERGSPAALAGLEPGDQILEMDGKKSADPFTYLGDAGSREKGKNDLTLKVQHSNGTIADIGPFVPYTIGLHPTQLYESISMALLFLLLLAYMPYRQFDGAVMVLFMLCYAVHRFLNEVLRNDTDYIQIFGLPTHMTLSQNISIVVFVAGIALGLWRLYATRRESTQPLAPSPQRA